MEREPMNGPEPPNLAPASRQNFEHLAAEIRRADRVQKNLHRYAGARLFGQGVGEPAADFSVPENILLHRDRDAGGFNPFQHGWIEVVSVIEYLNAISFQ